MRLKECRILLNQGLQRAKRPIEVSCHKVCRADLIQRARILGTDQQGTIEQLVCPLVVAILLQEDSQTNVGFKIVGIYGEFLLESVASRLHVAAGHLRLAQVGIHVRQVRINFRGFGEIGNRGRVLHGLELGHSQQKMRFRRVAVAQDAVDHRRPFIALLVSQKRGSEHVGNREIVGRFPLLGLQ